MANLFGADISLYNNQPQTAVGIDFGSMPAS
jgi:hypothetical protein